MPKLPKIALQRLDPARVNLPHPEADLLTAFVENSLTQRERTAILQHLSACIDCREIVALSLPDPSLVTVAASPVPTRIAWPVLRWAALAACVVVVGAAVMLRHQSHSSSQEPIAVQTSNPASSSQSSAGSAGSPAVPSSRDLLVRGGPAYVAPGKKEIASSWPANLKQSSPKPATPPTVREEISGANIAEAKSALARSDAQQANAPAEPAPNANLTADEIIPGRAKDAGQDTETMRSRAAAPMAKQKSVAAGLAVNTLAASGTALQFPRWTLTSDGTLQRSLDAGQTWQTVPIANAGNFRALAANGLDIWVGGSKGALYHSIDAGQHWRRVQPIANGDLLSSDIIGVQFTDLQHGSVTTAAKETWNTDDAGQTWTKQ